MSAVELAEVYLLFEKIELSPFSFRGRRHIVHTPTSDMLHPFRAPGVFPGEECVRTPTLGAFGFLPPIQINAAKSSQLRANGKKKKGVKWTFGIRR